VHIRGVVSPAPSPAGFGNQRLTERKTFFDTADPGAVIDNWKATLNNLGGAMPLHIIKQFLDFVFLAHSSPDKQGVLFISNLLRYLRLGKKTGL
jgi:hypothetical protein